MNDVTSPVEVEDATFDARSEKGAVMGERSSMMKLVTVAVTAVAAAGAG